MGSVKKQPIVPKFTIFTSQNAAAPARRVKRTENKTLKS